MIFPQWGCISKPRVVAKRRTLGAMRIRLLVFLLRRRYIATGQTERVGPMRCNSFGVAAKGDGPSPSRGALAEPCDPGLRYSSPSGKSRKSTLQADEPSLRRQSFHSAASRRKMERLEKSRPDIRRQLGYNPLDLELYCSRACSINPCRMENCPRTAPGANRFRSPSQASVDRRSPPFPVGWTVPLLRRNQRGQQHVAAEVDLARFREAGLWRTD